MTFGWWTSDSVIVCPGGLPDPTIPRRRPCFINWWPMHLECSEDLALASVQMMSMATIGSCAFCYQRSQSQWLLPSFEHFIVCMCVRVCTRAGVCAPFFFFSSGNKTSFKRQSLEKKGLGQVLVLSLFTQKLLIVEEHKPTKMGSVPEAESHKNLVQDV